MLLPQGRGNGQIIDERGTYSYSDIHDIVHSIGSTSDPELTGSIECLCIPVENSVRFLTWFVFLVSARVNIYLQTTPGLLPSFCDKTLLFTDHDGKLGVEFRTNPQFKSVTTNNNLKGVYFSTSGSTGEPKFAFHRVEALAGNAENVADHFKYNNDSRVLISVPVGHMFGFGVGLLPALLSGANICMIEKTNVVKMIGSLQSFRPNYSLTTPTLCKMLLQLNRNGRVPCTFICAGDSLNSELFMKFENMYGPLVNLYGCTELGAIATSLIPDDGTEYGSISPLPGVTITIDGNPKGEIQVKYDWGFDHYLASDGHHIEGYTSSSLYQSRDFGVLTGNRSFKVLGRIDNCINRFGFLVSLREIEKMLEEKFPELNEVVAFELQQDTLKGKRLVGVLEFNNSTNIVPPDLMSGCRRQLPKHFVPDEFHAVPSLPRFSNGKVDRQALYNQFYQGS